MGGCRSGRVSPGKGGKGSRPQAPTGLALESVRPGPWGLHGDRPEGPGSGPTRVLGDSPGEGGSRASHFDLELLLPEHAGRWMQVWEREGGAGWAPARPRHPLRLSILPGTPSRSSSGPAASSAPAPLSPGSPHSQLDLHTWAAAA